MKKKHKKELFLEIVKEILSRDRFNDKLILNICEYLLEGNLVIRYSHVPKSFTYEEKLKFTPETIDWEIEYGQNTNLCQLYLHSFETVKYLLQGYELSGKESYLSLAKDIIHEWIKYTDSNHNNRFPWYDHCVSDRTLYLIYFLELIHVNNLQGYESFMDEASILLEKQAEFLFEDQNYTTQNHGTMMDRSLYLLSKYIDGEDSKLWGSKAVERLREAVQRDFSKDMVNWENSSSYHLFNFDIFVAIEKTLLNKFNDSLGTDFQKLIDKGIDYMVYLSKPDLYFPTIGDGSKFSISSIKSHTSYKYVKNHEKLKYVLSNGEEGKAPDELCKV